MLLFQKNVPNIKVTKMFVFAYSTTAFITIYRAPNIQRDRNIFRQKIKLFSKSMGKLQIKSRQIRFFYLFIIY